MTPPTTRSRSAPGTGATIAAIRSITSRIGDRLLCEHVTYPGLRTVAGRQALSWLVINVFSSFGCLAWSETSSSNLIPSDLFKK